MKVQEIISAAYDLVQKKYEETETCITYLNMALGDLTTVAKIYKEYNVSTVANETAYNIPADSYEIIDVLLNNKVLQRLSAANTYMDGYKLGMNKIILVPAPPSGSILRVQYYAKLSEVSSLDDIPDLPVQFHYLLVLYVVAKLDPNYVAEYERKKRLFALDRIWQMEPYNRQLIRKARVLELLGVQR